MAASVAAIVWHDIAFRRSIRFALRTHRRVSSPPPPSPLPNPSLPSVHCVPQLVGMIEVMLWVGEICYVLRKRWRAKFHKQLALGEAGVRAEVGPRLEGEAQTHHGSLSR